MRRSVLAVSILGLVILLFLIHSVFTLLQLLVETGEAEAIQRSDIPPVEEKSPSLPPPLIPKIIHQTYKNESIPERWKEPFVQCQDLHKDYTFYVCYIFPEYIPADFQLLRLALDG